MGNGKLIHDLCEEFADQWRSDKQPAIGDLLNQAANGERAELFRKLLEIELDFLVDRGSNPTAEHYENLFPEFIDEVHSAFTEVRRRFPNSFDATESLGLSHTELPDLPSGETSEDVGASAQVYDPMIETQNGPSVNIPPELNVAKSASSQDPSQPVAERQMFGRYRADKVLGKGSYGIVYLGFDLELERNVAIKVPHSHNTKSEAALKAFRDEGRVLAGLDHPNILPVYDVGVTDDGRIYVVSKYVSDSMDLTTFCQQQRPSHTETTNILAQVADGLNHAHTRGLVHRDIKPDNILIDNDRIPYVVDFGLALHEDEQSQHAGEILGSPAYMSPEQFRGEAHHLDGRSDIWSLGVVLYELIVGRRPFEATTRLKMQDEVLNKEPKPPRQIEPLIPKKLEEVCLKSLSKDLTQRYSTAADVARDLREVFHQKPWYQRHMLAIAAAAVLLIGTVAFWLTSGGTHAPPTAPLTNQQVQIDGALASLQGMLADKDKPTFDPGRDLNLSNPIGVKEIKWPPSLNDLRDQIAAAKSEDNKELERSLLFKASQQFVAVGQYEAAEAICLRMRDLTKDSPVSYAFSLVELGLAQSKNRRHASAVASYQKCIEIFEEFHRRIPNAVVVAKNLGTAYLRLGNVYKDSGHLDQAAETYEKAKRLYERHNLKSSLSTLLGNYGNLQSHREKLKESIALHEQSRAIAVELNDDEGQATALAGIGNAYQRADRTDEALKYYRDALTRITDDSSYELKTIVLLKLSMILLKNGEIPEAKTRIDRLDEIASLEDTFIQGAIRSLRSALNANLP